MAEDMPTKYDSSTIGVVNFDPAMFNKLDRTSNEYSHPFGRLVEVRFAECHSLLLLSFCTNFLLKTYNWKALWPGDLRKQLKKLNEALDNDNATEKLQRKREHVDEDEWWHFWGS